MTYEKNDNDIVIIQAIRTPFLKAKNTISDDSMLTQLLKHVKVPDIEEVILGNVLTAQGGVVEARCALLRNKMNIPIITINKQCCSGLEAVKMAAERVKDGCIIAGGYEIMSNWRLRSDFKLEQTYDECDGNCETDQQCNGRNIVDTKIQNYYHQIKDCRLNMGETSELLAIRFGLSREEIDKYAYETHIRAYNATKNNLFKEIVPIIHSGQVYKDDNGVRNPDIHKMYSLKPVFKENGVSTAGNSSQLSDGAALIVVCKRRYAELNNYNVICRYIDSETSICEPAIMGYSPVLAVVNLLLKNNIRQDEVKFFEVNEAFGSQALCCMRELDLNRDSYNVFGGSIAIGHPVGASGTRLIGTLKSIFDFHGVKGYGVAALCAATGLGMASLFHFE